jgi:hypothetical protein
MLIFKNIKNSSLDLTKSAKNKLTYEQEYAECINLEVGTTLAQRYGKTLNTQKKKHKCHTIHAMKPHKKRLHLDYAMPKFHFT